MFPNFTLTIKGEELLNKAIGERKIIKFTVFELGKGDILENEDIREVEDVKDIFKTIPVLDTQVLSNQMLKLKGYFDNKGLSEDTLWKEIGVFAQLGEDSLTEIMYSYTNAGNEGTLIPSETRSQSFRRTLDIRNYIGYATDITFNITELRDKYAFNTLREMQVATFLREGDKIELWGNENLGDISLKFYIVESENNEGILLENGLYANIYEDMAKKQNETENRLLTAAKTIWESINELFTKKANKDDVENNLITVDEGKILDARQGPAIVNKINGLAGGYSGTFPLTTAVKEGIYLLPATNKFYVCVENYSGSSLTAPNANFEELSVFQNRNKLENLSEILIIDGWTVLKNSNGLLELFKKVNVQTNVNSVYFDLPISLTDEKRAVGNILCIHTATSRFRAYDLGIYKTQVCVRVYSSNASFNSTCNIWLKGFWK